MKLDYYDILQLPRGAKRKSAIEAFKRLSVQWHPDSNPGYEDRAEKQFRRISEAYQILSDPKLGRMYRKSLKGKNVAEGTTGVHKKAARSVHDDESAKEESVDRSGSTSSGSSSDSLHVLSTEECKSTELKGADLKLTEKPIVMGHKYKHAQLNESPDETPLGMNLMVQQIGGNSVTSFPETLLSLRNPFRVYNEVVRGAQKDTSLWTYCEQLVEWHIASKARLTDLFDVFGNSTVVTTEGCTDGMKSIAVKRNGKQVHSLSVKVEMNDWLKEDREAKGGAGHIVIIDEAPVPPPGMLRLPRDPS